MVNVLRRELRTVITGRVLRQGFLHILEHIDVVHDDAAGLAGIHAVGAGDGLHERVPLHRFVQIERGQVLHIETGQPHGTDKHELQGIIGIFEAVLNIQAFRRDSVHLLPVHGNVEPLLLELLILIGFLRDDDRHFHTVHVIEDARQLIALFFGGGAVALLHDLLLLNRPVMLHLVVHLHRRILIDGDDHALPKETAAREMMSNILGDLINAILPLDDLQNPRGGVFQQAGLVLVQVFLLDDVHHIVVQKVIFQPDLRYTAGIEQRHRGAVLHRLGEVIL